MRYKLFRYNTFNLEPYKGIYCNFNDLGLYDFNVDKLIELDGRDILYYSHLDTPDYKARYVIISESNRFFNMDFIYNYKNKFNLDSGFTIVKIIKQFEHEIFNLLDPILK